MIHLDFDKVSLERHNVLNNMAPFERGWSLAIVS